MGVDEFIPLIQGVGFPVFVAVWLLVEQKKSSDVINQNTAALAAIKEVMENCPIRKK